MIPDKQTNIEETMENLQNLLLIAILIISVLNLIKDFPIIQFIAILTFSFTFQIGINIFYHNTTTAIVEKTSHIIETINLIKYFNH